MMPGVLSVRLFLLIQVEVDREIQFIKLCVAVETWITGTAEGTDKAHLTLFFALKNIACAAQEGDRILSNAFHNDFHAVGMELSARGGSAFD